MPILWDQYTYPKHQPLPKGFIEDLDWAHEHVDEFMNKYPNQWVAVYNKEVVRECTQNFRHWRLRSVGTDLGEVKEEADQKAVDRSAYCIFAYKTFWYRNKTKSQDKD